MNIRTLLVALTLLAPTLRAGEVLDRMVATVNGHAILQSDWNDEVHYECFMSGRPLADLTTEDRRAAFERLIDQELLREQMGSTDFKPASSEEVAKQMDNLKKQYAQEHSGQEWNAALSSFGTTDAQVADHVALELNSLRLVDSRLRPTIQVDNAAIENYYKTELLPKVGAGQRPSLQEATPTIRELLVQQQMNQALSSWLESMRSQAQIRMLISQPPTPQVKP
jgi:hypothetical protein